MADWQLSVFSVSLLLSALLALWVAVFAWRQSQGVGRKTLSLLMLFVFEWSFTSFLGSLTDSFQIKMTMHKLGYIGVSFCPALFFILSLELYHQRNWLNRPLIWLLFLFPVVTILIVQTNEWHHWFWRVIEYDAASGNLLLMTGFWFQIHLYYSYFLLAGAIFALSGALLRFRKALRSQALAALVAVSFPILANLVYLFSDNSIAQLDLTPHAFSLTGLVLVWAIGSVKFMNPLPVAREKLLDLMSEAVIVLDDRYRVTYLNPVARNLLNTTMDAVIGSHSSQILGYWPYLVHRFNQTSLSNTEVLEIQSQDGRWFDLRISPLVLSKNRTTGWLVILSEITQRKQVELDLADLVKDLHTVSEISTILTATLDPQVLLQKIVDLTQESFDLYFVEIYLVDTASQQLALTAGSGALGRQLVEENYLLPISQEPSIIAKAARTGKAVTVNDVRNHPDFLPHPSLPETCSEMALPLISGSHIAGVLDLQDKRTGRFTDQMVNLFSALAAQISVALNNAGTFEKLQNLLESRNKELELMYVMGMKISEGMTVSELFMWLVNRLPHAMRFPEFCRAAAEYEGITYGDSSLFAHINQISAPIRIAGQEKGKITVIYLKNQLFAPEERNLLMHTTQAVQNFIIDETIHQQRFQIKETLQIAQMGYFEYDFTSKKALLSEELLQILGAPFDQTQEFEPNPEFLGKYLNQADVSRILESLDRAYRMNLTEVLDYEIQFQKHVEGGVQPRKGIFRARVQRDHQGAPAKLLGSIQDITDRLEAEEQIRRLAAVIDQAKETIVITDLQGNIVYANPFFEVITGYTANEALGKNPRLLKSGHHSQAFYENLWQTITSGKTWNGIFVNRRKDGSLYHEAATIFPILNAEGRIINYAAVKRDISAEVAAETKAREAAHQQSMLMEITMAALEKTDLPSMLQILADRLIDLVRADGCFLALWADVNQPPVMAAASGILSQFYEVLLKVESGQLSLLSAVLNSDQAMVVEDTFSSPYIGLLLASKLPSRTIVGLPLIASGQRLGAALVAYNQPTVVSDEMIKYHERIAAQISLALIKAWLVEEEQNQRHLAEAMQETGQVLSSTLEINQLLDLILDQIQKLVPYDTASLLMLEDDKIHTVRSRGFEKYGDDASNQASDVHFELSQTNAFSRLYNTKQPLIIFDAQDYLGWIPGLVTASAWIGAPILAQDRVIGFLSLTKAQPGFYRHEHALMLSAFSGQAALALQNAELFQTAQRRATEAETLRLAAAAITSTLKLEEIIELILEQLNYVVPYDSASVLFLKGNELEIVGGRGFPDLSTVLGMRFSTEGNNPSAVVYKTRQPYILENAAEKYTDFLREPHNRIKSWLGVPLILQDRIMGMIALDSEKVGAFSHDHARLAVAYADQVAIALENANLFEQVQKLAITDPLTGLYNRRYFFAQAKAEFERARRYQQPLSIIMLDLDDFKNINDRYGHATGDLVLQNIARICKDNVREIDVVGRYGGEEFVILLPETPLVVSQSARPDTIPLSETGVPNRGAVAAAERLRTIIAGTVIKTEAADIQVTVSLGVAEYTSNLQSPEALLDLADQAQYRAKNNGKNQVAY